MVGVLGSRFRSLSLVGSVVADVVDIGLEVVLGCCVALSCAGELPLFGREFWKCPN